MGIVLKQSIKNVVVTYVGFVFGAINTLFLYTNILPDAYYGLVTFILASGAILMPLLAFGTHNAMVRFYSKYKDHERDRFLTFMLLVPLLGIIPMVIFVLLFSDTLGNFISQVNPMVREYVWHVVLVGVAMAYFEVFYAWCRVHLKSVFGNFMKEVFGRIGVSLLLIALFFDVISLDAFFNYLVGLYLLRTLILKVYAFRVRDTLYIKKLVFDNGILTAVSDTPNKNLFPNMPIDQTSFALIGRVVWFAHEVK